ncbi:serine/threonine-protein kinase [uncultured Desulfosarcina sp.]|uniref:serine/threonine-protein kinase n=1 Tax=uncultured Desulfosarcina sp. TaxID=218289 RepID=UPI0029C7C8DA|nr:serine/threonine-protein kinase [uncultured Desulfosarcina sp.]
MATIGQLNLDHLVGQQVGTSVLLKKLGHGAMSAVFVAFQKTLKRQIAVKILPKALLTEKTAAFFQQEAESAAILSHPHIIQIYEVGETKEFLFFTMQLVKGNELSYFIRQAQKNIVPSKRFMPIKTVVGLMIKILDGLAYAHDNDIVHRDIKPDNVMIEHHSKRPLITDFGVARVSRTKSKSDRLLLGTPVYIPPEQILSGTVDGRADMYSAGVMMLEMLMGRLPYPPYQTAMDLLKMKLGLKDRIFQQRPSQVHPVANRKLDEIVFKALAFDRDQRYASCREFASELEAYLGQFKPSSSPG